MTSLDNIIQQREKENQWKMAIIINWTISHRYTHDNNLHLSANVFGGQSSSLQRLWTVVVSRHSLSVNWKVNYALLMTERKSRSLCYYFCYPHLVGRHPSTAKKPARGGLLHSITTVRAGGYNQQMWFGISTTWQVGWSVSQASFRWSVEKRM